MTEQQRNRRNNVMYNGECASEASKRLGGKHALVAQRVRKGWSLEKAFTTSIITRYKEELLELEKGV